MLPLAPLGWTPPCGTPLWRERERERERDKQEACVDCGSLAAQTVALLFTSTCVSAYPPEECTIPDIGPSKPQHYEKAYITTGLGDEYKVFLGAVQPRAKGD